MDFINGIGNFFKKSKIISILAPALNNLIPGVGPEIAGVVGNVAGSLGLGKKKKRKKAVPTKSKARV